MFLFGVAPRISIFDAEYKPNFWLHGKSESPLDSPQMGWWIFHGERVLSGVKYQLHFFLYNRKWSADLLTSLTPSSENYTLLSFLLHPFCVLPLLCKASTQIHFNFRGAGARENLGPNVCLYQMAPIFFPSELSYRKIQKADGVS